MQQTIVLHPSAPWVAFPTTQADRAPAVPTLRQRLLTRMVLVRAFKNRGLERAIDAAKTEVAAGLAVTMAAKGAPRAADLLLRAGA